MPVDRASGVTIRAGIGGWSFDPWKDNFYPKGLPASRELAWAAERLTAIEINATFYRNQTPTTYAKWAASVPATFVFAIKGPMSVCQRKDLRDTKEAMTRFLDSGIAELGSRLGPVVWQFSPHKRFDPDEIGAFLAGLPRAVSGLPLRHVLDVRHASFLVAEYVALARSHDVATVYADSDDYPALADVTGPLVYTRLMRTRSDEPTGYAAPQIQAQARAARIWSAGGEPPGVPCVAPETPPPQRPRDVFMFYIAGAKERAPAAAMALLARLAATGD